MNVVTFETAKRLKDAGFPQPQVFHIGYAAYECSLAYGPELYVFRHREDSYFINPSPVFAPTATDILNELPESYLLGRNEKRGWYCSPDLFYQEIVKIFYHSNPAESCAAAWLAIHEKTETK